MPFQTQVNMYPAAGVPGMQSGLNPTVMALPIPLADEGGVTVGAFVWPVDGAFTAVANTGTGAPYGFAARVQDGIIPTSSEATMTIPSGRPVVVVRRGDRMAASAADVTAGQKVFADLATGAVSAADADTVVEGAVETDWLVMQTASAGDAFLISNW